MNIFGWEKKEDNVDTLPVEGPVVDMDLDEEIDGGFSVETLEEVYDGFDFSDILVSGVVDFSILGTGTITHSGRPF